MQGGRFLQNVYELSRKYLPVDVLYKRLTIPEHVVYIFAWMGYLYK